MAGSSVIGALRVNLGIDTAAFSNGLKNAQSRLSKFGDALKVGMAASTAFATAALGALAIGIKRTIGGADDLLKASQKFGVPIEELSRLKHAADLSGVAMEGLGTGLRKLSQNMQETANGAKNTASAAFNALGISVTDANGKLKDAPWIMEEIAARFNSMEDGAQKTALAMAIFGRSGTDLIPMLNAGGDGLRQMMEEADSLGIVLTSSTAKAAEAFNDNLTRLNATQDALILKITAALLPTLERLSEEFLEFANNEEVVSAVAAGMVSSFHWIANEIAQLAILANRLNVEITGLTEAMSRLGSGDFSGAWEAFSKGQEASGKMAADMKAEVDRMFDGSGMGQGAIQRRINDAFGSTGTTSGKAFVAKFAESVGGGSAKKAVSVMTTEAARIFEATRTPLESYSAQIGRLNHLLAAGAINQDTYNRAVIQAQDALDQSARAGDAAAKSMDSAKDALGSGFAGILDGLLSKTLSWKDALMQAGRALFGFLNQMNVSKGGSGILGGGFLQGLLGGLIGFRNGGSFDVGGSGGIDSQLVAFKASPNERVSVTKPGQDLRAAVRGGDVYHIDARGADAAAIARLEAGLAMRDKGFDKNVDGRNHARNVRNTRG